MPLFPSSAIRFLWLFAPVVLFRIGTFPRGIVDLPGVLHFDAILDIRDEPSAPLVPTCSVAVGASSPPDRRITAIWITRFPVDRAGHIFFLAIFSVVRLEISWFASGVGEQPAGSLLTSCIQYSIARDVRFLHGDKFRIQFTCAY